MKTRKLHKNKHSERPSSNSGVTSLDCIGGLMRPPAHASFRESDSNRRNRESETIHSSASCHLFVAAPVTDDCAHLKAV